MEPVTRLAIVKYLVKHGANVDVQAGVYLFTVCPVVRIRFFFFSIIYPHPRPPLPLFRFFFFPDGGEGALAKFFEY